MKLWFKKGGWASANARRLVGQLAPDDVRSIVVIRHAAVGDMVLTRPFLIELRRFFPNAKITFSIVSNYQRGIPIDLVDSVHELYGSDQSKTPLKEQITRAKSLGRQDLLFDLAATSRSFWLCKLTKAKLKIGFPYRALQRYLLYDITIPRTDLQFEAENMLQMLNVFGHSTQYPPVFDLPVQPIQRERPYIVYFPSASIKDKCWPQASFADLVVRMAKAYPGYEHVVLEGIAEWEKIDDIMTAAAAQGNVTGLSLNDFDETISLIKGSMLLVGNDTGIRNMAIACETPTVGVFYSTPVFRYWPRYSNHEVAFTSDGAIPSVDQVFRLACKVLGA